MDERIERAKKGDREALEALLSEVAPSVRRFGLRMCRNEEDAKDVLQDTLLSIVTHLGEYQGRASFSSWVFALTRTACARRRRGKKNGPAIEIGIDERVADSDPEQAVRDKEQTEAIARAFDALPADAREVIWLRDVEGLSASDAAAAVGISTEALKSRLHRAREALREALRPVLEEGRATEAAGCPDVVALWSKQLEGELSPGDCAAMERHIATCPACETACGALKQALWTCQRLRTDDVPEAVKAEIDAAVRTCVRISGRPEKKSR